MNRNDCCDIFKTLSLNVGNKGFSIYKDELNYNIRFRSVNEPEVKNFINIINSIEDKKGLTNISISGNIGIKFCPFCGTKLDKKRWW